MLRYIIGISVLTLGIIIVRALSNGKVLRKLQYAFWIVIPLYMILFPFIKIDLPNEADLKPWLSHDAETTTYDIPNNTEPTSLVLENATLETNNAEKRINLEPHSDPETIEKTEQIADYVASMSENKIKAKQKTEVSFKIISYSVSAVLIIALIAYNAGFISYCNRNRKFIGRDPYDFILYHACRKHHDNERLAGFDHEDLELLKKTLLKSRAHSERYKSRSFRERMRSVLDEIRNLIYAGIYPLLNLKLFPWGQLIDRHKGINVFTVTFVRRDAACRGMGLLDEAQML